jgi:hypothetical protein
MKPKLASKQAPKPGRCQALVLGDLLSNTSLRLTLEMNIGVDRYGQLSDRVIAAALVSNPEHGPYSLRQCTRKPVTRRGGKPVCRLHYKARYFLPWTPRAVTRLADALRELDRIVAMNQLRIPDDAFRRAWGETLEITDWTGWVLSPAGMNFAQGAAWARSIGSTKTLQLTSGDTLARLPLSC